MGWRAVLKTVDSQRWLWGSTPPLSAMFCVRSPEGGTADCKSAAPGEHGEFDPLLTHQLEVKQADQELEGNITPKWACNDPPGDMKADNKFEDEQYENCPKHGSNGTLSLREWSNGGSVPS